MSPTRSTSLVVGAASALALLAPTAAHAAPTSAYAGASTDPVVAWYDATSAAVTKEGWPAAGNLQVTASRAWALSWGAADVATHAVEGGSRTKLAAFATALHDSLVPTTPQSAAALDALRDRTLSGIPAKQRALGVAAGARAAKASLAARRGDGLDPASVNAPFTPPAPAPGVWRPTPPANAPAVQAGQGRARPFVIPDVATRFRAAAPPAIDSPVVIRDLNEIARLGSATSTERTPAQTQIAKFWSQTSVAGFTSILRGVVTAEHGALARRTHQVAEFHRVTTDAQIATYASKYVFLRWRPVTALTVDDGNPATPLVPGFTPLITTPAHPEYPSGHTAYAGAAEEALRTLVGARPQKPIVATSTALPDVTRTYTQWRQATQDNIDARVWEGIHLRSTDTYGARYGARIAAAALKADGERAAKAKAMR